MGQVFDDAKNDDMFLPARQMRSTAPIFSGGAEN